MGREEDAAKRFVFFPLVIQQEEGARSLADSLTEFAATETHLLRLDRFALAPKRVRYEQVQPALVCHRQFPPLHAKHEQVDGAHKDGA